jgi:hypothetical protein
LSFGIAGFSSAFVFLSFISSFENNQDSFILFIKVSRFFSGVCIGSATVCTDLVAGCTATPSLSLIFLFNISISFFALSGGNSDLITKSLD